MISTASVCLGDRRTPSFKGEAATESGVLWNGQRKLCVAGCLAGGRPPHAKKRSFPLARDRRWLHFGRKEISLRIIAGAKNPAEPKDSIGGL